MENLYKGANNLIYVGTRGGVDDDGTERWTLSFATKKKEQLAGVCSALSLGLPWTNAVVAIGYRGGDVVVPSRNTPWVIGWNSSTERGGGGKVDIEVGVITEDDIEAERDVDGNIVKTIETTIEAGEYEFSILDEVFKPFWVKMGILNRDKAIACLSCAQFYATLSFSGMLTERAGVFSDFTDLTLGERLLPEAFRVKYAPIVMYAQAGILTMRSPNVVVSQVVKGKDVGTIQPIGTEKPPEGKTKFPEMESWSIVSDSLSATSTLDEKTRTTVYRGKPKLVMPQDSGDW